MAYIAKADEPGCFFCRDLAESRDSENLVVRRGPRCFCVMNRFPYNVGHLLVAPNAHKARLDQLEDAELLEFWTLTRDMQALLERVMQPQGFNLGVNLGRVAGAGVEGHIHLHIVPRWTGDTNFMPVVAATKVRPEALAALHARLTSGA
jgi:ATP adenylyltransferase